MEDKHLKMLGVKLAKTLAPPPPRNVSKEENKGEGKHIRRKRQTSCTDNVGFDARNTFQCCAGIIGAIQVKIKCLRSKIKSLIGSIQLWKLLGSSSFLCFY